MKGKRDAASGRRSWRVAEMTSNRWFLAETKDEVTGETRRVISCQLSELAPFIGRKTSGRWRCFAYLADTGQGKQEVLFDEIAAVTDLTNLGMLVFRLRSGLLGTETYEAKARNFVGAMHEDPPPLIKGEQVFEWAPKGY